MFAPPLTIDNFSIETHLKTVNSGGKNLGFGDERSWEKKLGFGGGFGYHNNTTDRLFITHNDSHFGTFHLKCYSINRLRSIY